jgi:uracil-DNA glycosylase family 4
MAVTSSQTLPIQIKLCKKACKSCGLSIFQGPAFDHFKRSNIFWVGLSAVQFQEGQEKLPLSPLTASGALIHSIETPLKSQFSFYKTNLVKCAPVQKDKIRYPVAHEMEKCFPNLLWELDHLQPTTVFLLGKQVSDFILKKFGLPKAHLNEDFQYGFFQIGNTRFIPVHHPSYILVYKRKLLTEYMDSLQNLVKGTGLDSTKKTASCSKKLLQPGKKLAA